MSDARSSKRGYHYRCPIKELAQHLFEQAQQLVDSLDYLSDAKSMEDRAEGALSLGCALDEVRVATVILSTRFLETGLLPSSHVKLEWDDKLT